MKFSKIIASLLTLISCTQCLFAQCEENSNVWNDSWTSCEVSTSPNAARGNSHWLLYEFDEAQIVDDLYIWNANKIDESQFGVKDAIIDYSVDGVNWIEMGNYIFPQANESDSYEGFEGADLGGLLVKKILITCVTNYASNEEDCVSIAEIQFKIGEAEDEEENLKIYPNPVTATTTIEGVANSILYIYDLTGKIVFTQEIINDEETLNLSSLSPGVYFVDVLGSSFRFRKKLLKVN